MKIVVYPAVISHNYVQGLEWMGLITQETRIYRFSWSRLIKIKEVESGVIY